VWVVGLIMKQWKKGVLLLVLSDEKKQILKRTGDGSPDLGGRGLPHLQRRLLAVPRCVRRADQVGGVFQGALRKTATHRGRKKEND